MRLRAAVAVTAVLAAVLAPSAASAARADDPATACKSGGFANYVDPTTGQPFSNQGSCVSYVRDGDTLTPVAAPVWVDPLRVISDPQIGGCDVVTTLHGEPGAIVSTQWLVNGQSVPGSVGYPTATINPDGSQSVQKLAIPEGSDVVLLVNGAEVARADDITC